MESRETSLFQRLIAIPSGSDFLVVLPPIGSGKGPPATDRRLGEALNAFIEPFLVRLEVRRLFIRTTRHGIRGIERRVLHFGHFWVGIDNFS